MTPWWWSWLLTVVGLAGLWLITRKDWRGYIIGVAVQALWVLYAIATLQWGFIVSAVAYGAVNTLGLYRWRFAKPKPLVFPKHAAPQVPPRTPR